ncbi:MAG: S24 family peptidase [Pikeienuella sp.]
MTELNIRPPDLHDLSGVDLDLIRKYRSGKVDNPRGKIMQKLAEGLGIHENWLRNSTPPKFVTVPVPVVDSPYPGKTNKVASPNKRIAQDDDISSSVSVLEIDIRAGAGGGGMLGHENITHLNELTGNVEGGDGVVDTWSIPSSVISSQLRIRPENARIISIVGNSMSPTLQDGDRILVDTGDRLPSPPGVFALWDGLGVVVKSVERVAHSDPPKIRCISDNTTYTPYELTEDEANIIGRVRWRASPLF